ncbi:hypothetical protein Tco_1320675 [Tanacetum coccineum]
MCTPMATERLDADLQGTPTDQKTYRRMIGGLMYLTASRPDIAFATFVCARYQARPTLKHLKEVKRIFRYLRQSYNMGVWYLKDSRFELIAYSDADHAGCKDDYKSTSGGLQFLVIWMRTQLLEYGYKYNWIPMYSDSKSAIAISCNPVQHSKTKHIDIRYQFIKEHVEKGTVEIYFVRTEYQLADLFTKALLKERFEYLVHRIVIIMAQQQHADDVHPDELCPPNKRYDLMDANKEVDLDHMQCVWDRCSSDLIPQPTESTQGTHRTPSAPRRSTRLTPPAPVPTVDKADEMILQDTLQVKIEKMVDGQENIVDDSSIPRNDEPNIPGTRIEPRSDKESPEVEIAKEKEVEISKEKEVELTNVVIPVNVNDEDEEITDEVYELKRREKGKIVEETRNSPIPTPIRSPRIHTNLVSSDTEKLQELTDTPHTTSSSSSPHKKLAKTNRLLSLFKTKPTRFKRYKSFFHELQGRYGYLFAHLRARFMPRKSFDTLADNLHDVMVETLPTMVDKHIKEQVMKQVPEQVRNQVPVYVAEGLILERQKAKEETERLIAKAILQERRNIQAQISTQIENAIANVIPSQVDAFVRSYMSGHILHVHPAQSQTSSVPEQQYKLYLAMKDDPQLQQQDIAIWLALQMKFERNTVPQTACRTPSVRPRYQDDPHDDAHPEGENKEQAPSTLSNQEQDDDFDFWTDSYASDDDEISTKKVSQDIMEEVSLTIDEAKMRKIADEILRQRCTSGDEHQKEILVSPHPRKTTPLVHSCQKYPEAPALSLINQDLLYLKKGNSGPEKIVLSLYKFPAIIFNDDDIEEQTSRWVNKCVKKFNPYVRYGVEHWKNPHAKIFYIRKQKEPGKPKEEIYSNSKIVQVIKTYWELGHEHKFITEIVARRANDCIVSITEPDYKNLNKNDIEDIYLLIMNGKVPDYADTGLLWSLSVFIRSTVIWERVHDFQLGIESYQQKVNLTAPTMTFPGIEDHEMFSIIYEPVHGIIYKNSKKEKRVMRHSEIHKFCDATLNRVLEDLKSYNNNDDKVWVRLQKVSHKEDSRVYEEFFINNILKKE